MRNRSQLRSILKRVVVPFRRVPEPRVIAFQTEVVPIFFVAGVEKRDGDRVGTFVGETSMQDEYAPKSGRWRSPVADFTLLQSLIHNSLIRPRQRRRTCAVWWSVADRLADA